MARERVERAKREEDARRKDARARQHLQRQQDVLRRRSLELLPGNRRASAADSGAPWILSESRRSELREVFVLLDSDMDGVLNEVQLRQALQTLGLHPTAAMMRRFCTQPHADHDRSGKGKHDVSQVHSTNGIPLERFMRIAESLLYEPVEHDDISQWLALFGDARPCYAARGNMQAPTLAVPRTTVLHMLAKSSCPASLSRLDAEELLRLVNQNDEGEGGAWNFELLRFLSDVTDGFSPVAIADA